MKLLLTGSTGFVGRNFLLEALSARRYDQILLPVRSIEKLRAQFIGDGFDEVPPEVFPFEASAIDWKLPYPLEVDEVVHSAGVLYGTTREDYTKVNCEGTYRLMEALPPSARIVVLSSQAAAGPSPRGSLFRTESDLEEPLTWYGQSKLEMERTLKRDFDHLNYLCFRPPIIIGPRDTATLPLFKMVRQPLHFKPGFRTKHFSFISVNDLTRAITLALSNQDDWKALPQRHFFVASHEYVTDKELLAIAAEVSRKWGMTFHIPQPLLKLISQAVDAVPLWRRTVPTLSKDRAKEIWPDRWLVTPEAFCRRFSWEAVEDVKTALAKSYEWYVRTGQLPASTS